MGAIRYPSTQKENKHGQRNLCAFGVDVDAAAGWLGSYGGEDSPDDIPRGLFAGKWARHDCETVRGAAITYDVVYSRHSIETFPEQMKAVVEAGHEVGIHGYSHENLIAMTPAQEEAVLDPRNASNWWRQLAGKRPTGYVAPWWEFSNVTNELLLKGH